MPLFTIILDYRGGTYVEQVGASDPANALKAWARAMRPGIIKHLGQARQKRLVAELEDDHYGVHDLVLLQGLTNVWCTGLPCGGLVNIIRTEEFESPADVEAALVNVRLAPGPLKGKANNVNPDK